MAKKKSKSKKGMPSISGVRTGNGVIWYRTPEPKPSDLFHYRRHLLEIIQQHLRMTRDNNEWRQQQKRKENKYYVAADYNISLGRKAFELLEAGIAAALNGDKDPFKLNGRGIKHSRPMLERRKVAEFIHEKRKEGMSKEDAVAAAADKFGIAGGPGGTAENDYDELREMVEAYDKAGHLEQNTPS